MKRLAADLVVYGDGMGACAAAISAKRVGMRTALVRRHRWLGGQMTSQMVPPDEHPWIEQFGCTATYREFRNRVRAHYRSLADLLPQHRDDPLLNPGRCWVSRLGHEPEVAAAILEEMVGGDLIEVVWQQKPQAAARMKGNRIEAISIDDDIELAASMFIDASETGELLPVTGTAYRIGAESQNETGEEHARSHASPLAQQAITWCFAIAHRAGGQAVVSLPSGFESPVWPGYPDLPLFGWSFPSPITGEIKTLPPYEGDFSLFAYRRVIDGDLFSPHRESVSVVNWPQNDYFLEPLIDHPRLSESEVGQLAREFSLRWLQWMQSEGGMPEFQLHSWAEAPYVRESRRMVACKTIREEDVSASANPALDRAPSFPDSVGIGAYRIDLHPRTDGDGPLDLSSLPFEIPLGSLIPQETRNLIAGGKNLATTHITNGCYRLHPVEWNIGEAAGILAGYCLQNQVEPADAWSSSKHLRAIQSLCETFGIELRWPEQTLASL
ncbi:MAG: hypothetical protein HONBIEJF_01561 [Fimbriimonadaceae bacterium]|nr:hypothetical protein [Fimbriimonadaceae bacterium]